MNVLVELAQRFRAARNAAEALRTESAEARRAAQHRTAPRRRSARGATHMDRGARAADLRVVELDRGAARVVGGDERLDGRNPALARVAHDVPRQRSAATQQAGGSAHCTGGCDSSSPRTGMCCSAPFVSNPQPTPSIDASIRNVNGYKDTHNHSKRAHGDRGHGRENGDSEFG